MAFSKFKNAAGKTVRVDLSKVRSFADNGQGTTIDFDNGDSLDVVESVITVNNRANTGAAEVVETASE